MVNQNTTIPVGLNEELVKKLLNGLYNGAKNKGLRVIVGAQGNFYVESKELRITIETRDGKVSALRIRNEKLEALVTDADLQMMQLTSLADNIVKEIASKYSPVFHSLADNIVAFSRSYGAGA